MATRLAVCHSAGLRIGQACLFMALLANLPVAVQADDAAQLAEAPPEVGIDELIRRKWRREEVVSAPRCDDRTFVRRVYLDLAGRIPTPSEVATFLTDGRSGKRDHLVDALLASEDHVQHVADVLDAELMGRAAADKYAERTQFGWRRYLEDVVRRDRPWNEVTREILLARPSAAGEAGSVWFLYERNNQHQAIAEAIAPAFFGIRVECAQCHDHMLVDEIKQAHYWGLVAFFGRGKNQQTKNGPRVVESAIGGFSEFASIDGSTAPNRLTFVFAPTVAEQRPAKGEKQEDSDKLYVAGKLPNDPRVPVFSRRQRFVDEVLSEHPLVARAMVNRLWKMMLGRGLVHPHDEMDSSHPASHPVLLDWLARDFETNGYRMRSLLRRLALSDVYQLASARPKGVNDPALFAHYLERRMTAEQLARSFQMVIQGAFQNDAPLVHAFRKQFPAVLPDETSASVSEALFLSNSTQVETLIRTTTDERHLLRRLAALPDDRARVERLFEVAFARLPDEEETNVLVTYLEKRAAERMRALEQAVWSVLTSAEFCMNH